MTAANYITIGISFLMLILSAVTTYAGMRKNAREAAKEKAEARAEAAASMAVMETKIEELTREVRKHNNFAERLPVVEEQIKVANHRIKDLEGKVQ